VGLNADVLLKIIARASEFDILMVISIRNNHNLIGFAIYCFCGVRRDTLECKKEV